MAPTEIWPWSLPVEQMPYFVNIMLVGVISASGKKLGIGDHRVQWQRPQQCPQSMSPKEFEALPTTIEVREVHLLIQQPGFRQARNHSGDDISRP